jgi:hypothetical protein
VPQNQCLDYNQNTNVAVVPGEQVFIAVLDLASWGNAVSGSQCYVHRDAWYAQLVPPQYALAQIVNPALVPRPALDRPQRWATERRLAARPALRGFSRFDRSRRASRHLNVDP